jgi:hypothetical protein
MLNYQMGGGRYDMQYGATETFSIPKPDPVIVRSVPVVQLT